MIDEAKECFKSLNLSARELAEIAQAWSMPGTFSWAEIVAASELLKEKSNKTG